MDFRLPHRLAATLVTSRNAVSACPLACRERPLFAVGSATATCATEAGFTQVIDADGDAMALAGVVESRLSPKDGSLFFPTARGQGFPLVNCLRQRGYSVIRRVAYEATPVPVLPQEAVSDLEQQRLTAALFFSTETARHFVRLVLEAGLGRAVINVKAVSISERAAMPLRKLPWRQISVAVKPNQDAILALLT